MDSLPNNRPLTTQVTISLLVLGVFTLCMAVGFGAFAMLRADADALRRQKALVENGLHEAMEAVQQEQASITVWDDAVTLTKAGDEQWMKENVGEWMAEYYGHDRAFVLDERNRPVHVMMEGLTVPPARYSEAEQVIGPMAARLRVIMASNAADPDGEQEKAVVEDLVSLAGQPAIASIMPFVPSSDRVTQEPGSEYLDVAVQFVDDELIGTMARKYLLADAKLVPLIAEPEGASVPLMGNSGMILGYIGWTPTRPGTAVVLEILPALVAGVLLAFGVLFFLLRRLRRASDALQISRHHAEFLAYHDTLTGLPNRALLEDRLHQALAAARRVHSRVALLYVDLDRFKIVNDTLGHPAGDELIKQTAQRLKSCVREMDTVSRLGGDEFAVILPAVKNAHAAEQLSEKLLDVLARPFMLMGEQAFVGASIGIALSIESDATSEDLSRKADIALYEAKRNGRGRYEVFAGDMDDLIARRRVVENDLRAALEREGELSVAYLPVFASDGRTILGAEALIRWNHPVHAALPTSQVIGIAEERGIIGRLGQLVLVSACRLAATTELPWVAVNVSPVQLREEGFADEFLKTLAFAGLAPARLQIDIREGVLADNHEAAVAALDRLRRAGVRVALDDFGTGHSSISNLRRKSIDKLKLDRSFVRQLGTGEQSHAVVDAIVRLARALGLPVTAEGIETVEQRDFVLAMGCSELQGRLLSMPLTEDAMRAFAAAAPAAERVHAV